jgi:hypothetical protein
LAGEARLDVGQPGVIRPLVAADSGPMAALGSGMGYQSAGLGGWAIWASDRSRHCHNIRSIFFTFVKQANRSNCLSKVSIKAEALLVLMASE